jgi:hypothetical protein
MTPQNQKYRKLVPHNPQIRSSACSQDLSSLLGPKNFKRFFYFPIGKSAPTKILVGSPLHTRGIGLRNFARSVVEHWTLESPKPDNQSTLTFSLSGFSLSRFRHSRCRTTRIPDSRFPICRNSDTRMSLTFQLPSLHRHFGVRNIVNPDAIVSGLLTMKL